MSETTNRLARLSPRELAWHPDRNVEAVFDLVEAQWTVEHDIVVADICHNDNPARPSEVDQYNKERANGIIAIWKSRGVDFPYMVFRADRRAPKTRTMVDGRHRERTVIESRTRVIPGYVIWDVSEDMADALSRALNACVGYGMGEADRIQSAIEMHERSPNKGGPLIAQISQLFGLTPEVVRRAVRIENFQDEIQRLGISRERLPLHDSVIDRIQAKSEALTTPVLRALVTRLCSLENASVNATNRLLETIIAAGRDDEPRLAALTAVFDLMVAEKEVFLATPDTKRRKGGGARRDAGDKLIQALNAVLRGISAAESGKPSDVRSVLKKVPQQTSYLAKAKELRIALNRTIKFLGG